MIKPVKPAFEMQGVVLPLDRIMPIRQVKPEDHTFGKYRSILASIREIGLVEPLVVHPQKGSRTSYLLLDGHMRLKALKELAIAEAACLVATEDDAFTYNDKISRVAPIQEHRMIMKAIEQGVTPEQIAKSLDVEVDRIRRNMNLLEGIHPDAVEMLKDKPITDGALRYYKKVKAVRQLEFCASDGQHGELFPRVCPGAVDCHQPGHAGPAECAQGDQGAEGGGSGPDGKGNGDLGKGFSGVPGQLWRECADVECRAALCEAVD